MRDAKFWLSMVVFQVAFGMIIFAFTRQHYIDLPLTNRALPGTARDSTVDWLDSVSTMTPPVLKSTAPSPSTIEDPFEISRQADEFFSSKQYSSAAMYYEQLLLLDTNNVDVINNLGLTLHYLGSSTEALQTLTEGIAIDPMNQRIWLTLGFVSLQIGSIEESRTALTTAIEISADSQVGQSAAIMLENLPARE
ncbi:MAG: hypothetical protein HQ492_01760 [Woeseiaceae bacterium]|nr:hypothetical protein [Woeseiaceae bacterium]